VLAPVSIVLVLPAVILYRLAQPSASSVVTSVSAGDRFSALKFSSYAVATVAFALGLAGLAFSFTTIESTSSSTSSLFSIAKRAVQSSNILKTSHGRAGLALFILFYAALPLLFILNAVLTRLQSASPATTKDASVDQDDAAAKQPLHTASVDTAEKLNGVRSPTDGGHTSGDRSAATTPALETAPSSPRRHQKSLTSSSFMALLGHAAAAAGSSNSHHQAGTGRRSSDSIAMSEPSVQPSSFEVVNRPRRRHLSATNTLTMSESSYRGGLPGPPRRSLSDVSWLERRRSVNAVVSLWS
jgi:hypothetical protein